jgi:hypothetical protein
LSREYCQYGLRSGVDSRTGSRPGGVWYAEAELMKTYWPVRLSSTSSRVWTSAGVKARKSATTSNSRSPMPLRRESASLTSPISDWAPSGIGRVVEVPRLSTNTSNPCSRARTVQAELMMPVPPRNRTEGDVMPRS